MIPRPNRIKPRIKINCFTCGKEFYRLECQIKDKERCYCSRKCQNQSPYKRKVSSKRMEKNNPSYNLKIRQIIINKVNDYWKTHKPYNYIDGSSRSRKYTKRKWIKIAKECYKRDKFTCQQCGKKGGLLNAHHILPWAGNKELRYDLNNLITLCVSCHGKLHNQFRREIK